MAAATTQPNLQHYGVRAVDLGLQALEFLATVERASPSELAEGLGVHKNTAFRLLATFFVRGYVEGHPAGGYCLTRRLDELAEARSRRGQP